MSAEWGLWQGEWRRLEEAALPLMSDGAQFGLGVFTTMGVRDGRVLDLELHEARLQRDAAALSLATWHATGLASRCAAVIERNGLQWAGLKVVLHAGPRVVAEWIQPRSNPYPSSGPVSGRRLTVRSCSPRRHSPLYRLKSLNYAEHLLAQRSAKAAGFDDALWVDHDGAMLETSTANLFLVRQGVCYTPPVSEGILPGVVRQRLLGLDMGVVECPLPFAWLAEAEEIFVTNSLGGVMPVACVDDRIWAPLENGWLSCFSHRFTNR